MSDEFHWSDCATHNAPAYEAGPCDCGGSDLANYGPERFRVALVAGSGRLGFLVDLDGSEGFVEPHQLPTLTLAGIAASADLPDAHDLVARCRDADCVNLDDAREAIIAQLQAFAVAQGSTGVGSPHEIGPVRRSAA